MVRRVVQPLDQLNAASSQLTADTLATAKLQLGEGPIEVMQLSRTYNELLERLAQSWSQQRHHHNFNNSNQFSCNAHTRSVGVVSLNPLRAE